MSEKFVPESGQIVFTKRGHKVEFVTLADCGYIVKRGIEVQTDDDEYETYFDILDREDVVFENAPTPIVDAEVRALEERADALRQTLSDLQKTILNTEAAGRARLEKWAKIEQLKHIDDFIYGRITHLVEARYDGVKIVTVAEIKTDDHSGQYNGQLRLLSLFGKTNGNLQWKLNHYADGSGSDVEVYPTTSIEEAMEIATRLHAEKFAEFAAAKNKRGMGYWVTTAKKIGIPVPEEIKKFVTKERIDQLTHSLAQKDQERAVLLAQIEAAGREA